MEKYSKSVSFALDDVPIVEKKTRDFEAYDGKKVKIAKIEIKEEINFFPDGKTYEPESTQKCFRLYIIAEPLKELDEKGNFTDKNIEILNEDGTSKQILLHARFNLNTGADGKPEISKHPKGRCWQFMRKLGATKLSELIGKMVKIDSEPSKTEGDDRKYLRLAV